MRIRMLDTRTVPHRNGREGMTETYHGNFEFDGVPEDVAEAFILEDVAEDCAGVFVKPEPEAAVEPEPEEDTTTDEYPEPAEDPELSPEDDIDEEI